MVRKRDVVSVVGEPGVEVWRPHPGPQTEVLRRTEMEVLYGGARGGGKTEAGLAWMAEPEYTSHEMFRGLVVRADANDLDDWLTRARRFYRGRAVISGNPPVVHWLAGGVIRTGHWKDKATISKYVGKEYQKMLLEEVNQGIVTLEEYLMLRASCRSSIRELYPQIMANTNPGGPGHGWVKRYWIAIEEQRMCESCHGEGCEDCFGVGAIPTGKTVTSCNKPYHDPVSGFDRVFIPSKCQDNPSLPKEYLRSLNALPEPLRSAWRDGDWDCFEGQFFVRVGARMTPWEIGAERAAGRLFGSLDIGITHPTSFGLWYLSSTGEIQRLFTYKSNSGTHRDHAMAIKDRIETFRWTDGVFPIVVWCGHDSWTKTRMREDFVVSPIDEYQDVFHGKGVRFERANVDRAGGCSAMREAFNDRDTVPQVSYWADYNKTYEEDLYAMMTDKNHPETYAKVDGDDTADESRYGIVGLRSWVAKEVAIMTQRQSRKSTPIRDDQRKEYESMMTETALA